MLSLTKFPMEVVRVETETFYSILSDVGGFWEAISGIAFVVFGFLLHKSFMRRNYLNLREDEDMAMAEVEKQMDQRLSYEQLFKLFDRVEKLEVEN